MIELKNVSKKYGRKTALCGVTTKFLDGQVTGIVGRNGAGKTTLFRCTAGLELYHGRITSNTENYKSVLGFLPTEPFFFSKITGREYLRLVCHARSKEISDVDHQNIFDLPLDQYAATYSTGMKKKLALTGILLQKNEYYLLDEPLNGVDIQSNAVTIALIKKLKSIGKTVVISSHIFSILKEVCDHILVLDNGVMCEDIAPDEFLQLEQRLNEQAVSDKVDRLNLL